MSWGCEVLKKHKHFAKKANFFPFCGYCISKQSFMTASTQTLMERFDALADRHIGTVRLMCWRRSYGNEATCDDLMQECLVSIWRRLPTLRADCTAREEKAWVRWCCRSVFSHLHRQHRLSVTGLTPDMTDTLASPAAVVPQAARQIAKQVAVSVLYAMRHFLSSVRQFLCIFAPGNGHTVATVLNNLKRVVTFRTLAVIYM